MEPPSSEHIGDVVPNPKVVPVVHNSKHKFISITINVKRGLLRSKKHVNCVFQIKWHLPLNLNLQLQLFQLALLPLMVKPVSFPSQVCVFTCNVVITLPLRSIETRIKNYMCDFCNSCVRHRLK